MLQGLRLAQGDSGIVRLHHNSDTLLWRELEYSPKAVDHVQHLIHIIVVKENPIHGRKLRTVVQSRRPVWTRVH